MIRLSGSRAFGLAAIGLAAFAVPCLAEPTRAVLELFTSQGCSSCPPADALLAKLAKRKDVVVLSYSVDYWNYLGWHDTLSSGANSERQREYARMRGDGKVYTPQLVVDGVAQVNGSDGKAIEAAMAAAATRLKAVRVPVSARGDGDTLVIEVGEAPEKSERREATVWLAVAKNKETVSVTRGENRGKKLAYRNPVRELLPVGMWKGEAMTVRLPLKDLKTMGGDRFFALLQVENGGPILGVAELGQL